MIRHTKKFSLVLFIFILNFATLWCLKSDATQSLDVDRYLSNKAVAYTIQHYQEVINQSSDLDQKKLFKTVLVLLQEKIQNSSSIYEKNLKQLSKISLIINKSISKKVAYAFGLDADVVAAPCKVIIKNNEILLFATMLADLELWIIHDRATPPEIKIKECLDTICDLLAEKITLLNKQDSQIFGFAALTMPQILSIVADIYLRACTLHSYEGQNTVPIHLSHSANFSNQQADADDYFQGYKSFFKDFLKIDIIDNAGKIYQIEEYVQQIGAQFELFKKTDEIEGLGVGTFIKTPHGYCRIENLHEGDVVLSYNPRTKVQGYNRISNISYQKFSKFIRLVFNNDIVDIAHNHKIYLPLCDQWISAQEIRESSLFFNILKQELSLQEIHEVYQEAIFYKLTIDYTHNFYIKPDLLVHNYIPAAAIPLVAQVWMHIEELENFISQAWTMMCVHLLMYDKAVVTSQGDFHAPIQQMPKVTCESSQSIEKKVTSKVDLTSSEHLIQAEGRDNKTADALPAIPMTIVHPLSLPAVDQQKIVQQAEAQKLALAQAAVNQEQPVVTITPTSYEMTQGNFHARIEQTLAQFVSPVKHHILNEIHDEQEHRWQFHNNPVYRYHYNQQYEQINHHMIGAVHNSSITDQIKKRLDICWLEQKFNYKLPEIKQAFFEQFFEVSGKLKLITTAQETVITLLSYYPAKDRATLRDYFHGKGMPHIERAYKELERREKLLCAIGDKISGASLAIINGCKGFGRFFFGLEDTIHYRGTLADRIVAHPVNQKLYEIIKLCETGNLTQAQRVARQLNDANGFAIVNEFACIAQQREQEKRACGTNQKVPDTQSICGNSSQQRSPAPPCGTAEKFESITHAGEPCIINKEPQQEIEVCKVGYGASSLGRDKEQNKSSENLAPQCPTKAIPPALQLPANFPKISPVPKDYLESIDNKQPLLDKISKKVMRESSAITDEEMLAIKDALNKELEIIENIKIVTIRHNYESLQGVIDFYKTTYLASCYYLEIIKMTDDVKKISENLNLDILMVQKIKDHIFIEKHILNFDDIYHLSQFAPDYDIALAWFRLMNNNFIQSDIILLQHELLEASIMRGIKINYKVAHAFVEKIYNWRKNI